LRLRYKKASNKSCLVKAALPVSKKFNLYLRVYKKASGSQALAFLFEGEN